MAMSTEGFNPSFSTLDGALAEQIYNAGRISGLQEASEFVSWIQRPGERSSLDSVLTSVTRVFAERAKRWWDTLTDQRAHSLVEQVPATPWDKRFAEADRRCFTLIFSGDLEALKRNVFDEDTPWGRASRAWTGDAVEEIARLRELLRAHGMNPEGPLHGSQGNDDAQAG